MVLRGWDAELMGRQMQAMFGGGGQQEAMFAKLDQMKEIITEVNTQFKDPVSVLREVSSEASPPSALQPVLSFSSH
jgi:hypothetical protein